MPAPKRTPEYRECPEAARAAESLLRRVITVPKGELERREAEYKQSRKSKPVISRKTDR